MQSVIETLNGAVPSSLLTRGMRWVPPQDRTGWPADVTEEPGAAERRARARGLPLLAESTASPGEMLPLAPDDCHPPGAVRLRVLVDGSLHADAHLREQLLQLADEMGRISRMRRAYRVKRGRRW